MATARMHDTILNNREIDKKEVITVRGSFKGTEARRAVREMTSGADVLRFLDKHVDTDVLDESVYSTAVKHCWFECVDFDSALSVFQLSAKLGKQNVVSFGIFFNVCAESAATRGLPLTFSTSNSRKQTARTGFRACATVRWSSAASRLATSRALSSFTAVLSSTATAQRRMRTFSALF